MRARQGARKVLVSIVLAQTKKKVTLQSGSRLQRAKAAGKEHLIGSASTGNSS